MQNVLSRGRFIRLAALVSSLAAVLLALSASSALAAVGPTVTLTNDANQPGVFGTDESVPKNVTYPYTVTFQVTLGGVTGNSAPRIDSITSNDTANNGTCQALIGTQLTAGETLSCTYTITLTGPQTTPFSDTVRFEYASGGADNRTSTSTIEFPGLSVAKSSTTAWVYYVGQVVPYSYTVTNTGTTALSGISLSDTNTDTAPSCTASTLDVATAMSCTGQHTVTAADLAAGGSLTNLVTASSNEAPDATATLSIPIAQAPAGGEFVIGNQNSAIGTGVTFWGPQWWKQNGLTGGSAPAAFKGFEDTPAAPACGQNWSTDSGNSTPPPAGPLPPYMVIIVSSHITQSGSSISGDTQHLVVVRTNAGYGPNPGHAGTGTVVATLC